MGPSKKEISSSYTILKYEGVKLPSRYWNFILSKWLRSYRHGNDYIKLINSDSFFLSYNQYLRTLLVGPKTLIRLAVLTDNDDVVLGFSVSRADTLDYLYVHKDCRRQGIGKSLVPFEVRSFTHLTKMGLKLWPAKIPNAIFNPFS